MKIISVRTDGKNDMNWFFVSANVIMKNALVFLVSGIAGGLVFSMFGDNAPFVLALVIIIMVDFATGLIRGFCGKSAKTCDGKITSNAAITGFMRKVIVVGIVSAAYQIDVVFNMSMVCKAAITGFSVIEIISIIENYKALGGKLPKSLNNAISALTENDK